MAQKKRRSEASEQHPEAATVHSVAESPLSSSKPSAAKKSKTPNKSSKGATAATPSAVDAGAASDSHVAPSARGRNYTVSLAIPGSLVAAEMALYRGHGSSRARAGGYAGAGAATSPAAALAAASATVRQIAAAAVAGCIDEVVVYDDDDDAAGPGSGESVSPACAFLAQGLQYLDTPPYLRKALCTMSPAQAAALEALGPMRVPHHPRQTDWLPYREGVVLKTTPPSSSGPAQSTGAEQQHTGGHCFVDVGLDRMAFVPMHLPRGARVTLAVGDQPTAKFVPEYSETMIIAEVVSAITPRVKHGMYWGFEVRLASSLHAVIKGCTYRNGYDLTIGTSASGIERDQADLHLPRYSHALLVFGGVSKGLAAIMEQEEALASKNPEDFFNMYLNVCPAQGCTSIRTEDAVLMALGYLRPALLRFGGNVGT